jgi:hypothetical protein
LSHSNLQKRRYAVVMSSLVLLGASAGFPQDAPPPRASVVLAELPAGLAPDALRPGASLPDAPTPNLPGAPLSNISDGGDSSSVVAVRPPQGPVPHEDCSIDTSHSPRCRVHWHQLILSSAVFNAFQNGGNLYTGYWYRWETSHGKWWDRYVNSVEGWHWNSWADQNPVLDDYVGHPMMGAITNDLWIQDDPKSMTVTQSNTWPYWRRMLRAGAFSTFYSFEWKMGPLGEAGIGHNGDHIIHSQTGANPTTETGWVELVTTPVGGALWTMAEDALDKHVVAPAEGQGRNPFGMLVLSFLEPAHATANIFRWRPPWYRDDRVAKAKSFWSDPPGEYEVRFAKTEPGVNRVENEAEERPIPAVSSVVPEASHAIVRNATAHDAPVWPNPGGVHEFGAWWGLSLISGHIWGYAGDIRYMPVDLRYTYLFTAHRDWTMRYAPEVTALAMLDQPNPQAAPNDRLHQRKRIYGSGVSPVGFESDFFPAKRVQPFLTTNGGFLYFAERVLSPEGSQWMYTIDFGTGIHVFRKARQDWTIGYRYQHLSNANISHHNPGTDTSVFYIGVSRFRTKGHR